MRVWCPMTFVAIATLAAPLFAAAPEERGAISDTQKTKIINYVMNLYGLADHPPGETGRQLRELALAAIFFQKRGDDRELKFPEERYWTAENTCKFQQHMREAKKRIGSDIDDIREEIIKHVFHVNRGTYLPFIIRKHATFEGFEDEIDQIRLSSDPRCLVVKTWKTIKVIDVDSFACIAMYDINTFSPYELGYFKAVAVTLDCTSIAIGFERGTIKLFELENSEHCIETFEMGTRLYCLKFTTDGDGILSVDCDGGVMAWNLKSESDSWLNKQLDLEKRNLEALLGDQDETNLSSLPEKEKRFACNAEKIMSEPDVLETYPYQLPLGEVGFICAFGNGTLKLYKPHVSAKCFAVLNGHKQEITALTSSPDGSMFASASRDDGIIKLWGIPESLTIVQMCCIILVDHFCNPDVDVDIPACFERIAAETDITAEALTCVWNSIQNL